MKTQNETLVYLAKDIIYYERAKNARTIKRTKLALYIIRFLAAFLLGLLVHEFSYVIFAVNVVICVLGLALNMFLTEVYKTYEYYFALSQDLNL